MHNVQLLELANSNRSKGWLGAMELMDFLRKHTHLDSNYVCLKERFEIKFGQVMLGGEHGCDEPAIQTACNECIGALVEYLHAAEFDH